MPAPVLVAYATRGGSTAEVAEAIAKTLREAGLAADVAPAGEVVSLNAKAAVVVGAPLYVGRFPREFHVFLGRHRERLVAIRPWVFVLGPTHNRPDDFSAARKQAEEQLRRHQWLRPAAVEVFGGRWNPKNLPFPFSLALRLPGNPLAKIPAEDVRDWDAIRAWALNIAREILPAA